MANSSTSRVWSRVLAVLFAIVLPLSLISAWAVSTVTSTDRWVSTLHPLASNTVITGYIAEEGAKTVIKNLHVKDRIEQALPSSASFLASTITTELRTTIATALMRALATGTFQNLWDKENGFTHQIAVNVLDGRANTGINQARDVVLNITPAIVKAINELDAQGITFLDPLKKTLTTDRVLVLRLLNERELERAQQYYHLATTLEWALPFLTLLFGLFVVFTARPRREGWRRLSLSVLASAAVTYCLLRIAITLMTPLAPTPPAVTRAVLGAVTSFLGGELLVLCAAGVLGLIVHWLGGTTPRAQSTRKALQHVWLAVSSSVKQRSKDFVSADWQSWSVQSQTKFVEGLRVVDVVAGAVIFILLLWWVGSITSLIIVLGLGAAWYGASQRVHQRLTDEVENETAAKEPQ